MSSAVAIGGRPNPHATVAKYAVAAAATSNQSSAEDPDELAWARAPRTRIPSATWVWSRKNRTGTARHEVSIKATKRPKASLTAKSASIGTAAIEMP